MSTLQTICGECINSDYCPRGFRLVFQVGSLLVITMECDPRIEKLREIKKKGRGEAVKGRHQLEFWANTNRL